MKTINPLAPKFCITFVSAVTIFIFLFALGMQNGMIGFFPKTDLPKDINARIWFLLAQIWALVLPIFFLLVCIKIKEIRKIFIPFVLVLGCQVVTEMVLFKYFFSSLIIPTALLYIGYRLFQLWEARKILSQSDQIPKPVFYLGLGLVYANLILWIVIFARLSFRFSKHFV
jgi:hypothetical protein